MISTIDLKIYLIFTVRLGPVKVGDNNWQVASGKANKVPGSAQKRRIVIAPKSDKDPYRLEGHEKGMGFEYYNNAVDSRLQYFDLSEHSIDSGTIGTRIHDNAEFSTQFRSDFMPKLENMIQELTDEKQRREEANARRIAVRSSRARSNMEAIGV